jgi:hypothetical protein
MRRILVTTLLVLTTAAPAAAARAPEPHAPIVVADQPVTIVELIHWQRVAALSNGDRRGHARWRDPTVRRQVSSLIISYRWIEMEAAQRGIALTRDEVLASFRQQRRAILPGREFARFLRGSGQTREDIIGRVRADLLSQRIREQVLAGVPDSEQERALERFVRRFRHRWSTVTACIAPYLVEECGAAAPPG